MKYVASLSLGLRHKETLSSLIVPGMKRASIRTFFVAQQHQSLFLRGMTQDEPGARTPESQRSDATTYPCPHLVVLDTHQSERVDDNTVGQRRAADQQERAFRHPSKVGTRRLRRVVSLRAKHSCRYPPCHTSAVWGKAKHAKGTCIVGSGVFMPSAASRCQRFARTASDDQNQRKHYLEESIRQDESNYSVPCLVWAEISQYICMVDVSFTLCV